MSFQSVSFLLFLTVAVVVYYALPRRVQYIWLFVTSILFYISWSAKLLPVLLYVTAVSYAGGIYLQHGKRKVCMAFFVVTSLAGLFGFKYLSFFVRSISRVYQMMGLPQWEPAIKTTLLPVGISFFTLKAVGYLVDVYRGTTQPEKNLIRYAAFVSFFPTILAGPIERSSQQLPQLREGKPFSYEGVKSGLLRMSWGYVQKLLIADQLAKPVNQIFDSYPKGCSGATLFLAAVLYGFQIYIDFSGYSNIAIGIASVLGFRIKENFRQPLFCKEHQRILGTMAYQSVQLVSRLSLYSAGRQQTWEMQAVPEHFHHFLCERPVAWSGLAFCYLGCSAWRLSHHWRGDGIPPLSYT